MIEKTNGLVSVQRGKHKWIIPVYAEISMVCTEKATLHDPPTWELKVRQIIHIGHDGDERLKHDYTFDLVTDACQFDNMAFDVA